MGAASFNELRDRRLPGPPARVAAPFRDPLVRHRGGPVFQRPWTSQSESGDTNGGGQKPMQEFDRDSEVLVGVAGFASVRLRGILTLTGAFGVQNAGASCEPAAPPSRTQSGVSK